MLVNIFLDIIGWILQLSFVALSITFISLFISGICCACLRVVKDGCNKSCIFCSLFVIGFSLQAEEPWITVTGYCYHDAYFDCFFFQYMIEMSVFGEDQGKYIEKYF